ncbi:MAG: 30S ribosomal protein S6 [Planctomycetota bacterium]
MPRIYEGMFLLDNQVVRQDWQQAKSIVTGLLEKHGGTVHSARRWDERRLAYPIKKRNRATFLLAYAEIPNTGIESLRRDLEINEEVLRYLFTSVDEIPEGEKDLSSAEQSKDFVVPTPPADDAVDPEPEEESSEGEAKAEGDDAKKDEAKPTEAGEGAEASEDAAPAADATPAETTTQEG